MLEIFLLIALGRTIAARAAAKGRSGTPFVLLLVFLWILGEVGGGIAGIIVAVLLEPNAAEPNFLIGLVGAVLGAALGATTAFAVVGMVSDARPRRRDWDDDEDDDDD